MFGYFYPAKWVVYLTQHNGSIHLYYTSFLFLFAHINVCLQINLNRLNIFKTPHKHWFP